MFPYFRLVKVLLAARNAPELAPLDESVVRFRVWPGDLDQNMHMNNGRYLTLMDLGRWDLMARGRLVRPLLARKWYPVVDAATIEYRRPLGAFKVFEMRTRLLAWDERHLWLEQRVMREGKQAARAVIRGQFRGPDGLVRPAQVLALRGYEMESPPLPPELPSRDKGVVEVAPQGSASPA